MSDTCQHCQRKGLAILPALYAVAPSDVPILPLATLSANYGQGLTDKPLTASSYYLRSLPAGYLYLLYPNNKWRGYLVDPKGLLLYYPDLMLADMPDTPPEKSVADTCKRQGHSSIAIQAFCIEDTTGPVWVAYSRHKWSKVVRKTHQANPAARMQKIATVDGSPFPHAHVASAKAISSHVANYQSTLVKSLNNAGLDRPLIGRENNTEPLAAAMLAMSGERKKPGLIMALHDPVGITIELNKHRNTITAQAALTAGIDDEAKARKRVVAEIIEGIRLNAEANPGPWYDKNYGPDRFLKHIDQATWKSALQEAKALKKLQQTFDAASADYISWKESDAWKHCQASDYDGQATYSARAHEWMVAASVAGSGLTGQEREKIWYAVLKLPGTSKDHWLNRSLAALHTDLIEYIGADKKEDKEYDAIKNATALAKTWTEEGINKLASFHADLRAARQASEATGALIDSASTVLMQLKIADPQAFNKLTRSIATVLITRADVVPQPVVVKGVASRVATFIHQIANVRAVPAGSAPIVLKPLAGAPGVRKGNFGSKSWELADAVGQEVVFKAPHAQEETQKMVAWVLRKLNSGANLNEKLLKGMGLSNVDLTVPKPTSNPFLENHLARLSAKADIGLSAGGVFFQIYSFNNALNTYSKGGAANTVDGGLGMFTAVLSATAGSMEVRAATLVLAGNKAAATGWMMWAGRLSMWAGFIEGAYLGYKGYDKLKSKDFDSGLWTISTGIFVAAGGVASFGAAAAGATSLVAGQATALSVLGLSLGPVGWTLLALALLGAAIYCAWQAWATDDANLLPVEYWLDNGSFGKRQFISGDLAGGSPYLGTDKNVAPFTKLQDEVIALQRVVLVAQGRLSAAKDRNGISIVCSYAVAVPRYEAGSRLEIEFHAIDEGRRFKVGEIICADGATQASKAVIEPKLTGMREGPTLKLDEKSGSLYISGYFSTMQDPMLTNKVADYFGWVKDTNVYADNFEMAVRYWPDQKNLAELQSTLEKKT